MVAWTSTGANDTRKIAQLIKAARLEILKANTAVTKSVRVVEGSPDGRIEVLGDVDGLRASRLIEGSRQVVG